MNRATKSLEGTGFPERRRGPVRRAPLEVSSDFDWPAEVKITIYLPHPSAAEAGVDAPCRKHIRIYDVSQLREGVSGNNTDDADGRMALRVQSYRIDPLSRPEGEIL